MAQRKIAAILILLLLIAAGYVQEKWVINLIDFDLPLLMERSWVYLNSESMVNDPRWLSTLIYFTIFSMGGSIITALWIGKQWGIYTFHSYLILGSFAVTLALLHMLFPNQTLLAIARAIKAFYLSIGLPLLWIFLKWLQARAFQ